MKKLTIGLIILLSIVGLFYRAFIYEPASLEMRVEKFNSWKQPGLKVAFFSDLHAGSPYIDEKYIEGLVKKINLSSPDLILIGGDLLINGVPGGKYMSIEALAPMLKKLSAPLGVYAVLGNHDWWNRGRNIMKVLTENGIQILENDSRLIERGNKNSFWLVGIGDVMTKHADPEKAFKKVGHGYPILVFMHDPGAILKIKRNFTLAFAGHLHGGQVYLPFIGAPVIPSDVPRSWVDGWTHFKFGSLFVSKGIGTSVLPVRLNAIPEYVILNLGKTSW